MLLSGLLALWIGSLLAPVHGYPYRMEVAAMASLGLIALMLGSFWGRQLYDPFLESRSMAIASASLPTDVPRWLTGLVSKNTLTQMFYGAVLAAAVLGGLLQFYFHTGRWTMALVIVVLLGSYCLAVLPQNWLTQGAGGLAAGFALGLLPLFFGFYIQSGHWASELFLYGLPLSFSAFCVCLAQGFWDYTVDLKGGRPTLVTHLGLVGAALVYTLVNILTIVALVLCILFPAVPLPYHQGLWFIILLAVVNQEMVKRRQYRQPRGQAFLWGLTWLVNLSMGGWFLVMIGERL